MRIVSWNVAGRLDRAADRLAVLRPDLAVVIEATEADAERFALRLGGDWLWAGEPGKRGVGIVAGAAVGLTARPIDGPQRLFLSANVSRDATAFWLTAVAVKRGKSYAETFSEFLDRLPDDIARGPAALIGDFNLTVRLDEGRSSRRQFAPLLRRLEALGFTSAWHVRNGELFGSETAPTYHHHWRDEPTKRFHIDYAFIKGIRVKTVELGSFEEFVRPGYSDHLPLVVEVELGVEP
jgi:hypothetical protein